VVPLAVEAQRVALPWAPLAHANESEWLQAQWLPVRQASRPVARPLAEELAPLERPEQWQPGLPARSALPLARQEQWARSV
jgi:hypothetical protein